MRIIEKKIWPKFFRTVKARKKNVEIRLADFRIKKGDRLILCEWSPGRKSYTGRKISRRVQGVHKVDMTKFHSVRDLKRYGLYAIELQ